MKTEKIPELQNDEISVYFRSANKSSRRRMPKVLHNKGEYLNRVFNFILFDSYMQPHRHPSPEKIEKMHLIQGSFALLFFDDSGVIENSVILEASKRNYIEVPAFTWHTYVMLSDEVVVYETMEGVYHPDTWKELAKWAPTEDHKNAPSYLHGLKQFVKEAS